ncbi:hypothetical protein PHYPSEUDO_013686 [Phytophthora pseudosyringae]|uniref:Uncharacterized protein n=1 Tax=Phytophthora pseudosyringae TaxID=221518 RepID=A0A8T1W2E8_9STRA|nr:hypothetical protein PHYPSEUDO_013686 [Phytophthora pseudosyringae]
MPCQLDHLSVSVSMDATQQGALVGVVYLALSAASPLCAFTWNTSRTAAIGRAVAQLGLTEKSRDALAALRKTMPATGDAARQVQTVMDNLFHVLQHKYRVYEFFGPTAAAEVTQAVHAGAAGHRHACWGALERGAQCADLPVRPVDPEPAGCFSVGVLAAGGGDCPAVVTGVYGGVFRTPPSRHEPH